MQQHSIEHVYYGLKRDALENLLPKELDYAHTRKMADRLEAQLKQALSPEQWQLHEDASARKAQAEDMLRTQAFVEGFRMALRLCAETLVDD